jgi:hypothetical protein
LWDFHAPAWPGEVASCLVSRALGWTGPPTVYRKQAPIGPGSCNYSSNTILSITILIPHCRPPAPATGGADLLINNADRKVAMCWSTRKGICGYRSRHLLHREDKLRTVIWDFAEPIPQEYCGAGPSLPDAET